MYLKYLAKKEITKCIKAPVIPDYFGIYILQLVDNGYIYYVPVKATKKQLYHIIDDLKSNEKGEKIPLFISRTKLYRLGGLSCSIEESLENIEYYGRMKVNMNKALKCCSF